MIPNYDKKENIHYGVISIHNLNEFAYDGFEPENYISCPSYCHLQWVTKKMKFK